MVDLYILNLNILAFGQKIRYNAHLELHACVVSPLQCLRHYHTHSDAEKKRSKTKRNKLGNTRNYSRKAMMILKVPTSTAATSPLARHLCPPIYKLLLYMHCTDVSIVKNVCAPPRRQSFSRPPLWNPSFRLHSRIEKS